MTLSLATFEKYIARLVSDQDKLLLAISGGVDSMVICELLRLAGFQFELAHFNYHLRDEESNLDQKFIQQYAKKHKLTLHLREASISEQKKLRKSGTQEFARKLRYEWMEGVRSSIECRYIVTGHHADDQAETILFHFLRGSGPSGLAGMRQKEGRIVRPLLDFNREDILSCAQRLSIKWRDDQSNQGIKYTRNKIRNRILPLLEEINPGIQDTLRHLGPVYHEVSQLVSEKIEHDKRKSVREDEEDLIISTDWLNTYEYKHLLLWELLKPIGFHSPQVDEVIQLIHAQSGKKVLSTTHQVLRDRDTIIIAPIQNELTASAEIDAETESIKLPIRLEIELVESVALEIISDREIAYLDFEKLQFPLLLRPWKEGDKFRPFGMKGSKKISDFLIQQKKPLHQKDQVYVLESSGTICWVVGMRISEDFRIDKKTSRVWVCKMM